MAKLTYSPGQFHRSFNPRTYLDTYYCDSQPYKSEFFLEAQHNFWSNFERCSSNGDEIRCLEYGGGPIVAYLISAAPKVDRIVFADFLKCNRRAVLSWVAGEAEGHNWKPFIQHVVCDLERERSAEAVHKRELELRSKINSVVQCDINKSPIIQLDDFDKGKNFDVILTSMCLEICVSSEKQYKEAVAKLCEFLKPGGFLQIQGTLQGTGYIFANEKYYAFPSTKMMVEDAMKEAGLVDLEMKVVAQDGTDMMSDHKFMYHAVGRKL